MNDLKALAEKYRLREWAPHALGLAACVAALLLPLFLSRSELLAMAMGASGLVLATLATVRPVWVLTLLLLQFGFIPREKVWLGVTFPNQLQLLAPALLLGAVCLRLLQRKSFRPRPLDLGLGLFAVWCLVSMVAAPSQTYMKYYVNRIGLPVLVYFAVRAMDLSPAQFRKMLHLLLAGVVLTALFMVQEARSGHSLLGYEGTSAEHHEGVRTATGPFDAQWTSSAWLALWVPMFAVGWRGSRGEAAASGLGWALGAVAVVSTLERSSTIAVVLCALLFLALHRVLFRPRGLRWFLILLAAVGLYMLVGGGAAKALRTRLSEANPMGARDVYREAGLSLLRSSDWNPAWGVGFYNFRLYAEKYAPQGQVVAWGMALDAEEVAKNAALHNMPLALLVETGIVGFLLVLAVMAAVVLRFAALARARRSIDPRDLALLAAMSGSILSLLVVGWFQNTYTMDVVNCGLFTFLALLAGDWNATKVEGPRGVGASPTA